MRPDGLTRRPGRIHRRCRLSWLSVSRIAARRHASAQPPDAATRGTPRRSAAGSDDAQCSANWCRPSLAGAAAAGNRSDCLRAVRLEPRRLSMLRPATSLVRTGGFPTQVPRRPCSPRRNGPASNQEAGPSGPTNGVHLMDRECRRRTAERPSTLNGKIEHFPLQSSSTSSW
jgi:hypothetical protein